MSLQLSWIESANSADCPFPLNNLPYGVYLADDGDGHCCVAIGDQIADLAVLEAAELITFGDDPVFDVPFLNELMDLGPQAWATLRSRLTELFAKKGDPALWGNADLVADVLSPMSEAEMLMPFVVVEYTDFYASYHHATNVGTMFRGAENALPPNWLHIPIGYNGRASTVVVSGAEIIRPNGQLKGPNDEVPHFGPCQRLDIELELGAVVGTGTDMGEPISVQQADEMIFGYVLLNDWSARDIQAWEYQPLGPFQAKAFATSISPWVVTRAALEPFRCSTPERKKPLLDYLREPGPMLYDIDLSVSLRPKGASNASEITRTNYSEMYYSAAQQLCHHASSGCAMNSGDLLGSGTISGPEKHQRGSLLELTWGGKEPMDLPNGETRRFLEDGDEVVLSGSCHGDGFEIGFGDCAGKISSAVKMP